ncbi:Uncharacterised protein [Mycobacteroides abscessus subsp. massiliense]|nr:Uncharacterised protein [Mycobacteroides abscessus subsp. massiliense]
MLFQFGAVEGAPARLEQDVLGGPDLLEPACQQQRGIQLCAGGQELVGNL